MELVVFSSLINSPNVQQILELAQLSKVNAMIGVGANRYEFTLRGEFR